MIDVEPLIISELERMLPLPDGSRADWADVRRRAGVTGTRRRLVGGLTHTVQGGRRWRPILVAAVAVAALVGVGVAIAAGLGAFNGLSAAQHPPTAADVLPGKTRVAVKQLNASFANTWKRFHKKAPRILPGTARLLGQLPLPRTGKVYVATDTTGSLCIIFEGGGIDCTLPLSHSNPARTYESSWWGDGIWGPVGFGVVIDGITSVSFKSGSQEVTLPVKDNLWHYIGPNSAGASLTLHLANGSTEVIHECNGQCGNEGPPDLGNPVGVH